MQAALLQELPCTSCTAASTHSHQYPPRMVSLAARDVVLHVQRVRGRSNEVWVTPVVSVPRRPHWRHFRSIVIPVYARLMPSAPERSPGADPGRLAYGYHRIAIHGLGRHGRHDYRGFACNTCSCQFC